MHRCRSLLTALALGALAAIPGIARAEDVLAGMDLLRTDPATTWQDFAPNPLPAGFFGPGSDPFTGRVILQGEPLVAHPACGGFDLGGVDTIVRRRLDARLPFPLPSQDVVPIEIVALHLVSVNPITVTYTGGMNPESWNVTVNLSQTAPQPPGSMTVRKTHPNGGTFDSQLPVIPRFTFERQSDGATRVLDLGSMGQMNQYGAFGIPWEHTAPPAGSCTSNFCVNPGGLTVEMSASSRHGVYSYCPAGATGVEEEPGESWGRVKIRYR